MLNPEQHSQENAEWTPKPIVLPTEVSELLELPVSPQEIVKLKERLGGSGFEVELYRGRVCASLTLKMYTDMALLTAGERQSMAADVGLESVPAETPQHFAHAVASLTTHHYGGLMQALNSPGPSWPVEAGAPQVWVYAEAVHNFLMDKWEDEI